MEIDINKLLAEPAEELARLVLVDVVDLENCMIDHVRLYAYLVGTMETFKAQAAAAKYDLEFIESQVLRQLRRDGDVRTITEAQRQASEDLRVVNQRKRLVEAERKYGVLKSAITAFEHRRDMIVQLAARQRQEMSTYNDRT